MGKGTDGQECEGGRLPPRPAMTPILLSNLLVTTNAGKFSRWLCKRSGLCMLYCCSVCSLQCPY